MKRFMGKILMLCVVLSFAVINIPVTSNAYSATCVAFDKKSYPQQVTVGKNYKITKKGKGEKYVQFVVPATRKYSFDFSNYQSIGVKKSKDVGMAAVALIDDDDYKYMQKNPDYVAWEEWDQLKYKNEYGNDTLQFGSKKYSKEDKKYYKRQAKSLENPKMAKLYVRTSNVGKIKLNRGQVLFIIITNSTENGKSNKGCTCNLKIK